MHKTLIVLAGLAMLSTGAAAFQVQQSGGGDATKTAPAAPVAPAPAGQPELDLNLPVAAGGGKAGTEIRIPGLGKLGVIPKMDFGLELLYGANQKERVEPETQDSKDGELAIRGSIRHRF